MTLDRKKFFETKKKMASITPEFADKLEYFDFHHLRYEKILSWFKNELGSVGAPLLDIGADPYQLSIMLSEAGYQVEALNIQYGEYERIISDTYKIKINQADLAHQPLPYNDNLFTFILFSEVMEHLPFNLENLFKEFYRVLKPGGQLIITTPNLARLNNRIKMLLGFSPNWDITEAFYPDVHVREYTKKELEYLLNEAEFKNYEIRFQNFDYPNIPWIIKSFGRLIGLFLPSTRSNLVVIAKKN